MSLKKTLILACLLLAALAYILKVQLPKDEAKRTAGLVFPALNKDSVESITISSPRGAFTLKNTDPKVPVSNGSEATSVDLDALRKWEISEVPGADLDRSALNALITALLGLNLDASLPAKDMASDLTVYGLKDPALSVQVKTGGKTTEILFGKENAYVSKRYLKLGDRPDVYLIAAGLYSAADKPRDAFRNKAPIEFLDNELQTLTLITDAGVKIKFEVNDKYEWRIVEPGKYSASSTELSTLTREIRSLNVAAFIDGQVELAKYALDKPRLQVEMVFKESAKREPLHLSFSSAKSSKAEQTYLLVKGEPSIFRLEENPISQIAKPLEQYRERELFKFASDQAVQLDFELYKAPPISIVRTGTTWLVNSQPGDENFVKQLIDSLSQIRAEGFPRDNRNYGFANPRLKLLLRLVGPEPEKKMSERIFVVGDSADKSKNDETRYYAAVDDLSEPFIIGKEVFKNIFPREDLLVKAVVDGAPAGSATEIPQVK